MTRVSTTVFGLCRVQNNNNEACALFRLRRPILLFSRSLLLVSLVSLFFTLGDLLIVY